MAWAPVEQAVTTAWLGPLEAVPDRHLTRAQVDERTRDEERRHAPRPLLLQRDRGFGDGLSTPPMPEPISTPVRFLPLGIVVGLPAAESSTACMRRRQGVDDKAVDLALVLLVDPVVGIEGAIRPIARAGSRRRSGTAGARRRSAGCVPAPGPALQKPLPGGLDPATQRGQKPQSGDHDNAASGFSLRSSSPKRC